MHLAHLEHPSVPGPGSRTSSRPPDCGRPADRPGDGPPTSDVGQHSGAHSGCRSGPGKHAPTRDPTGPAGPRHTPRSRARERESPERAHLHHEEFHAPNAPRPTRPDPRRGDTRPPRWPRAPPLRRHWGQPRKTAGRPPGSPRRRNRLCTPRRPRPTTAEARSAEPAGPRTTQWCLGARCCGGTRASGRALTPGGQQPGSPAGRQAARSRVRPDRSCRPTAPGHGAPRAAHLGQIDRALDRRGAVVRPACLPESAARPACPAHGPICGPDLRRGPHADPHRGVEHTASVGRPPAQAATTRGARRPIARERYHGAA